MLGLPVTYFVAPESMYHLLACSSVLNLARQASTALVSSVSSFPSLSLLQCERVVVLRFLSCSTMAAGLVTISPA
jgi:hypothetical protein